MSGAEHKQALNVGYELKGYRVVDVLGVGGFGVTYLAVHQTLGDKIALKEYLPAEFAVREGTTVYPKSEADRDDFDWGLDRFLDEAKTLARFRHRNLVRVRDYFEANSTAYIVMDYEEGESLDRLLARHGTLSERQLRRILLPIVEGLREIHEAGYLHRDIKPSNVYVRRSDESPVLLDFGAARQALGQKSKSLTAVASAGYSPPEQYESEGEQGPWTDIYALSALCYRAITGDPPIEAPRRQSRLARGQPDPLSKLVESVPEDYSPDLLKAVDQGLHVIETERPSSLGEWLDHMQGAPDEVADPSTYSAATPSDKGARNTKSRRAKLWPAGVGALAIVAVTLAYWFTPIRDVVTEPRGEQDPSMAEHATAQIEDDVPPPRGLPAGPDSEAKPSSILGGGALLVVETDPPGAEVVIGGQMVGETPLERGDIAAGTYDVALRHPNYRTVRLPDRVFTDDEVLRIQETLVPGVGKLTVLTQPRDAWIERDGERLSQGTPVTLDRLPAGPLELTIGTAEHRSIRVRVEVPKDGVGRLERTLERIPYGTLTLELVPSDAAVTLPDVAPAYRPGVRLPEGDHRVVVSRAGYRELTRTVTVAGDTRERISLVINPQPFTVETTPASAMVRFVGHSEAYRDGILLEPGAYRIVVSAPEYKTHEETVRHGTGPTSHAVALARLYRAGQTFADALDSGSRGPAMVVIPSGSFRMGCVSGLDCEDDEKPVHRVTTNESFALGTYEVTVEQFRHFVEATGYETDAEKNSGGRSGCRTLEVMTRNSWDWTPGRSWRNLEYEITDFQPVTCVSWRDAMAYVKWLSEQTSQRYRLPSESEWEYAARAGSATKYYFGNNEYGLCSHGNGRDATPFPNGSVWNQSFCVDGAAYPTAVGSYRPNAFGLYDVHGNVCEWVEDCWNGSYTGAPSDGSAWLRGECSWRVVRGGGWNNSPRFQRSAYRFATATGFRSSSYGFRVARTLTP